MKRYRVGKLLEAWYAIAMGDADNGEWWRWMLFTGNGSCLKGKGSETLWFRLHPKC
jgi:hypothetical protein